MFVSILYFHVINWYIISLVYVYKRQFQEADCILESLYIEIKQFWCSLELLTMTCR